MNRICIAALTIVMICASGCGPSEQEVAPDKLLSAWDKDIKGSRADYIRVLISEGADVNARNNEDQTPLMHAAGNSSTPEIVTLLLEKGAEVEARTNLGLTPLMALGHNASESCRDRCGSRHPTANRWTTHCCSTRPMSRSRSSIGEKRLPCGVRVGSR